MEHEDVMQDDDLALTDGSNIKYSWLQATLTIHLKNTYS